MITSLATVCHTTAMAPKTLHPFIFCNDNSILIFLAHLYLSKFSITCMFHIICKLENFFFQVGDKK